MSQRTERCEKSVSSLSIRWGGAALQRNPGAVHRNAIASDILFYLDIYETASRADGPGASSPPRPPSLLPAATAELRATPLCEIIKIPTMQIFGGGRSRRPARGFPVSVPRPLRPGAKILIKSLARGRRSGPAGRFFN